MVTGATGRTGSLLFLALQSAGIEARAFVRNITKAREVLGCKACDESEGIYVGDITDPETLGNALRGVRRLVILTSSYPLQLPNGTYYFPPGEYPKDIDWIGSNNQVRTALMAGSVEHILLVSSMGTTQPDTFLDKLGDGHALFYKLNGEIDLMASGIPSYTIIKPGGLLSTEGGRSLLLAGHNDRLMHARVTRADVASVLLAAILNPKHSRNLRFDLSSDPDQPAGSLLSLFEDARDWSGSWNNNVQL
ncbi:hypothetical protein CEUSTIGMA_g8329.t1 [Chlamydomonas eustigma]|uniref:NAD(P)-binding domain-containing protein n=1 Tax=Chlamydomonas eustigma TaxID=1157962 RepID=A0A250XCU7_9CHLO|nr:hypothetical protein CEUSTIGMA_g8329.t1 [Chlamydomonas eustigma]|eukprot:GAX80894.1 hypothetical protein CEUSTIGMA_g8329.t1 [Chlamydomonas eustigma]